MPRPPRNVKSNLTRESESASVTNRRVREKDKPVRIRSGPSISATHIDGKYLGKKWRVIDAIVKGPGSKSGWGRLADGEGWVALDFVELLGIDLARNTEESK